MLGSVGEHTGLALIWCDQSPWQILSAIHLSAHIIISGTALLTNRMIDVKRAKQFICQS